ncbi:MAG: phage protease [Rhizobiaceae bacterium]|nr:phage protease [Rhizobiaceae bacterium]
MNRFLASLLAGASLACCATAVTAADAAPGSWVQLFPAGKTTARDGRGPFDAGDRAWMETVVTNTKKLAGSTEIVIDYDHQSVFAAVPGVGGTAKAAGWIKELQARDDGLYARVEWTEAATAAIRAGEYRYISPVFLADKTNGRLRAIRMAALTNTPALDMTPVAASTLFPSHNPTGDSMDKILAALGLDAGTNEDGVLAAINAMMTSSTAIAEAAGLTKDATSEQVVAAVKAARSDKKTIFEAAGFQESATTDQVVAAFKSKTGSPDPTKFVPIEQVTQLQKDMKTLQDTLVGDKAEEAVASAIKDGKLAPALKQWGLDLYKAGKDKFETYVASAPVLTGQQLAQPKKKGEGADALDDAQLVVCRQLGIDPKDYAQTIAAESAA